MLQCHVLLLTSCIIAFTEGKGDGLGGGVGDAAKATASDGDNAVDDHTAIIVPCLVLLGLCALFGAYFVRWQKRNLACNKRWDQVHRECKVFFGPSLSSQWRGAPRKRPTDGLWTGNFSDQDDLKHCEFNLRFTDSAEGLVVSGTGLGGKAVIEEGRMLSNGNCYWVTRKKHAASCVPGTDLRVVVNAVFSPETQRITGTWTPNTGPGGDAFEGILASEGVTLFCGTDPLHPLPASARELRAESVRLDTARQLQLSARGPSEGPEGGCDGPPPRPLAAPADISGAGERAAGCPPTRNV